MSEYSLHIPDIAQEVWSYLGDGQLSVDQLCDRLPDRRRRDVSRAVLYGVQLGKLSVDLNFQVKRA